jgi:hypothetical protein
VVKGYELQVNALLLQPLQAKGFPNGLLRPEWAEIFLLRSGLAARKWSGGWNSALGVESAVERRDAKLAV